MNSNHLTSNTTTMQLAMISCIIVLNDSVSLRCAEIKG